MNWEPATQLFFSPDQVRCYGIVDFGVRVSAPSGAPQTKDTWQVVDLTPYGVGADAKYVFLAGIMIITPVKTDPAIPELRLTFRKPGDNTAGLPGNKYYIAQCGGSVFPNGTRSNVALWVPALNGKIEWAWWAPGPDGGIWPNVSSYAANLSPFAWAK